MAEEVRFFLRTAAYSAVIAVVYWFVSHGSERGTPDAAGTAMLAAAALGCLVVALFVIVRVRGARALPRRSRFLPGRLLQTLAFDLGFTDPPADAASPLDEEPGLVPVGSPWPIVAAAGATAIGVGLLLGPWLLVTGVAVLASAVAGWLRPLST